MDPETMFGPLDLLYPYIEFVLLGLVAINAATRWRAYDQYREQYEDGGAEAIAQYRPLTAANVALLLGAFYYMTVSFEAGALLTVMVIGLVLTELFEFEARIVEARKEEPLDRPNAALAAWGLAALYVAYRALFFVIEPVWSVLVG